MSLLLYDLSLEYFDIFGTQQVLSKRKEFSLDDPQTTTETMLNIIRLLWCLFKLFAFFCSIEVKCLSQSCVTLYIS